MDPLPGIKQSLLAIFQCTEENKQLQPSDKTRIEEITRQLENLPKINKQENQKVLGDLKTTITALSRLVKEGEEKKAVGDLASRVEDLIKYGEVTEKFTAISSVSLSQRAKGPFKALFSIITATITDEINKMVYAGWIKKVDNENLKGLLENELTLKYESWAKEQQVPEKSEGVIPQAEKMQNLQVAAEEAAMRMKAIGGKRVELTSSDGVKTDATYLSAARFLGKLQDAGAQSISLTIDNSFTLKGITLPKANLDILRSLGIEGAGYCLVEDPMEQDRVFLMEQQQLQDNCLYFTKQGNWILDEQRIYHIHSPPSLGGGFKCTRVVNNLEQGANRDNGIALLTSGAAGVYETHKGEAMALLMQGLDVMLVNVRGYGASEGKPSAEESYLDIEAAYQYVKKERPGISDSKIVAWSTYLSRGIGAQLVEKHPEMNLFLNQTYADLAGVLKEQVQEKVWKKLGVQAEEKGMKAFLGSVLTEIIYFGLSFIAPNYSVKDRLGHIQGNVCTMQALSGSQAEQTETAEMAKVMADRKITHHAIRMPGERSTHWMEAAIPRLEKPGKQGETIVKTPLDFLQVTVNEVTTYLPKNLLEQEKGATVGKNNFERDKENPDKIVMTTSGFRTEMIAAEVKNFLHFAPVMGLLGYSVKWEFVGHKEVNQFLQDSGLSRPFIR